MIRASGRIAFTVAFVFDCIPRTLPGRSTGVDPELAKTSLVVLAFKIIFDEDATSEACRRRSSTGQTKGEHAPNSGERTGDADGGIAGLFKLFAAGQNTRVTIVGLMTKGGGNDAANFIDYWHALVVGHIVQCRWFSGIGRIYSGCYLFLRTLTTSSE